MSDPTDVRSALENLDPGTEISVRLENGDLVTGAFQGIDGDQVQLDHDGDRETHAAANVEIVSMDLSTEGPE